MNPAGPHPHPSDPQSSDDAPPGAGDATARRRAAALAGHTGDLPTARALRLDPDPSVRATALGALRRAGALDDSDLAAAAADPDPGVRRRLAEELGRHAGAEPATDVRVAVLERLLNDDDPLTVEAAAWALGEVASGGSDSGEAPNPVLPSVVPALLGAAAHEDPLVREATVAALGAIGDPAGLATVLAGTTDRPAIRRRAVLALAAFLGEPGVDEALERALEDRDWQVRQAAELLRRPGP